MTLFVVILSGAQRSRRTPPHVERLRLMSSDFASHAEKSSTGSLALSFAPLGMTTH
jgi:hypothetical protein